MIERSFEQVLEEIPLHKQSAEKTLVGLKVLPIPADNGNTLSWDDVLIYPTLPNAAQPDDGQRPGYATPCKPLR
ncbi:hypothetical protein HMPREF1487_04611 [Pseudomonas sp. HPB0071]|uniref:Uncharacterized protein n=1 Tax=Pseudomonas luteola TaxID=47886 RepID=A0A2X2CK58_PSELU|nr:hypothetical protein HMPREF1487_04611 [Pseudomonas sp. HPB0071]MBF8643547.1 hypothetical protein [Pseudomonas zeshuii]RRW41963.1 hypothetical protein EGJ50_21785 [Pseudomonas luteola]SHI29594.1 glutaredoxin 2 [Pseudomonas zeshuii]SPZ08158.1 Uncharacterised protein [Pseudomonas luteola]